jgi:hypothetical protein
MLTNGAPVPVGTKSSATAPTHGWEAAGPRRPQRRHVLARERGGLARRPRAHVARSRKFDRVAAALATAPYRREGGSGAPVCQLGPAVGRYG